MGGFVLVKWHFLVIASLVCPCCGNQRDLHEPRKMALDQEDSQCPNKTKVPQCTPEDCRLPQCYCNQDGKTPGNIRPWPTPQMVLFTYTGTVTQKVRDAITLLFPDTLKNPNNCPAVITLFVEGEGTDYCAVHRMYARGHEIATAGRNLSFANPYANWTKEYKEHREILTTAAYLDKSHVQGLRSRDFIIQGDLQYKMLQKDHYLYDSSLIVHPPPDSDHIDSNFWPFTMDVPLSYQNLTCHNFKSECPEGSYPGLWEMHVDRLVDGPFKPCAFLEDCTASSSEKVYETLKNNFEFHYNYTRSPFQVNLGPESIFDTKLADGIKQFLQHLLQFDDTWFITMQDAVHWMEKPVKEYEATELWHCRDNRNFNKSCYMRVNNNYQQKAPFVDILDVNNLYLWQSLFLLVAYIVILMYDKIQKKRRG